MTMPMGTIVVDTSGDVNVVGPSGNVGVATLPLNVQPSWAVATSGTSGIGLAEAYEDPMTFDEYYKKIAQEMICINPMFYTQDFLYGIIKETMNASYEELIYGVLTDSMMKLIEMDQLEAFYKLLKKAIDNMKQKGFYYTGQFEAKSKRIIDGMSRVVNKFKYDKLLVELAVKKINEEKELRQ